MRSQPLRTRRKLKHMLLVGMMAVVLPTTGCDLAAIGKIFAALGPLLTAIGGLAKPAGAATPGATTPGAAPGATAPGVNTAAPGSQVTGPAVISASQPRTTPFLNTDSLIGTIARSR